MHYLVQVLVRSAMNQYSFYIVFFKYFSSSFSSIVNLRIAIILVLVFFMKTALGIVSHHKMFASKILSNISASAELKHLTFSSPEEFCDTQNVPKRRLRPQDAPPDPLSSCGGGHLHSAPSHGVGVSFSPPHFDEPSRIFLLTAADRHWPSSPNSAFWIRPCLPYTLPCRIWSLARWVVKRYRLTSGSQKILERWGPAIGLEAGRLLELCPSLARHGSITIVIQL